MLAKITKPIVTLCDWVAKLAYVNLLWFLFTAAGLLIFGFMPATVALFTRLHPLFRRCIGCIHFDVLWNG
jgi:uncharacterized membrane protein YesL